MRALLAAGSAVRDEFPAAVRQKTMIRTGDELGSILKPYSISGLEHTPLCKHTGLYIAAIPAASDCPVDFIPRSDIRQGAGSAVGKQNWRIA